MRLRRHNRKNRSRINRNIVECKYLPRNQVVNVPLVLIETLWNVNTPRIVLPNMGRKVLIETLWNVNLGKLGQIRRKRYPRINRNIVECK